jgi:Zn-dependent peptidase ImmA (M78 family)
LIALFRVLGKQMDIPSSLLRRTLPLSKRSRFEDAVAAGERFAEEFALADVPARRLARVMEDELSILVLMVDPVAGVSGAACRLPELDSVLINRREVPGRRHFDLAHELFHILTWEAMPPERVEDNRRYGKGNRVEQLAENFASAVLMPSSVLARFGDWSGLSPDELPGPLNEAAEELGVTSSALRWRLVNAGFLPSDVARSVDEARLRNNGRPSADREVPPLFSRTFAEVVAEAIDDGQISVRRAAKILDLDVDELADTFAAHDVDFDPGI